MKTAIRADALSANADRIIEALRSQRLLLVSDAVLPSVAGLVAGAPVKGSWWGHPKGRDIWLALEEIDDHPDILFVKLVSGKVTLVHRRLWPALLAAATSREAWQTEELSAQAKRTFAQVEKEGSLRTDRIGKGSEQSGTRELEERLLVHSEQIHTESGAHARVLESWTHWAGRVKLRHAKISAMEGKALLERTLKDLGERHSAVGRLPWQKIERKPKGSR